eukprot:TRINITY_DN111677_c0_g1_i1.p1 TRINITY_DN111677_c0_g1~~TRINITY_DN111677_c0_g1_i1.p1  ORF type:complete len:178 (+),score=69.95 TRINITY_DN111677_c0_g1_i1:80-613(+)
MAPAEPIEHEEDSDDLSEGGPGLVWVKKTALESLKEALEKNADITKEKVIELVDPDAVSDDALVVPCDMSGIDSIEEVQEWMMSEHLAAGLEEVGVKKVAECFVKAHKQFTEAFQSMSEEEKASVKQEMTGAEYKEMLEEEMEMFAGSMEGMEMGESEAEEDDEAVEEAPAKKIKTA